VSLVGVVPHVDRLEVGFDLGSVRSHWDVVLVSEHASEAELEAYQVHPRHQAAVAAINPLVASRAIVDYVSQ
jgi:quinol monooxygenase YgiN